ncbi:MAG TPA: TlpA disulfide reductase family protein [Steroidobacteraceae bacterium]
MELSLAGYRPVRARSAVAALLCLMVGFPALADPVDLAALRGRVVYLDFWASWCGPCRQSFPWMDSIRKSYQGQGLAVLAVNVDQNRADADRFLAQFHPEFEVLFDPQGSSAERFKVVGMPTSFIIDRQGVVRYTHVGFWPADAQVATQQIRELLAEH